MVAGRHIPMLLMLVQPDGVSGELIIFRVVDTSSRRAESSDTCAPLRATLQTCVRVAVTPNISWDSVAARLDRSLGAWTISTHCESGTMVTDQHDLEMQRLVGSRFESYSCNAPRRNVEREAGRRSLEIRDYVRLLARDTNHE